MALVPAAVEATARTKEPRTRGLTAGHRHLQMLRVFLLYNKTSTPFLCRKRRCRISRQDSAVSISPSSSSSSSSSSSLCSPRTPSCLTPRPCPSSPSMTYTINVLHVPFLDSLTSVPPPSSPQHDQEWKQVRKGNELEEI